MLRWVLVAHIRTHGHARRCSWHPRPLEAFVNSGLISQLEPLVDRLNAWRGLTIEVVEQISRSPGSLDRHATTRSALVMRLESVGIAFSGARLMVLGKVLGRDVGYEAACDLLEEVSVGPEEIILVERFGRIMERHSTIKLIPERSGP